MWRTNSLEKTLMLGKIEGRSRRGWQDEKVGWYHWLNGHEFEQALRVGDGQGSLVCCSPWGHKESDTTEWLNWNDGSELCICLEIFLSSRFMSIVLWPEIIIVLWQENDLSFYLKMKVVEEGPGTTLSLLRHFFYLISNLDQIDYILCSQRWRSSIQSAKIRPEADCGSDHELLIAKFRLKSKKVEKTTRPFRYDLN